MRSIKTSFRIALIATVLLTAVVALSLDAPAAAKAFLKSIDARTLTAYTDAEGMALRVMGVSTVPSAILIHREGRELG